jgi:histidyl-tRNA synthetase
MRDFPPGEKILRDEIISLLKRTFELYGFNPLGTPIVERWEVLSSKYGGGADILKEAFRLRDQGGRELGLRYEMTTSLARFVGMNPQIKKPFKAYQIGPVYRDGPVKRGRYREFWQCDVDIVGARSMLADAEIVNLTLDFFSRINLEIKIIVNNRKLLKEMVAKAGINKEKALEAIISLDKLAKIGQEGVLKELLGKGIAKEKASALLEMVSRKKLSAVASELPHSEGIKELEEFFSYIDNNQVIFDPSLARGLAYYTGTIYEVYLEGFGSSLAAGGRYDEMIGQFLESKEQIPAVGISFGLEPIMDVLLEQRKQAKNSVTQVLVIPIQSTAECQRITQRLRRAGIKTDMDLVGRGISANLSYANSYQIPYALIVGPEELELSKVKLRDMITGKEELLTVEDVIEKFKER